MQDVKKTMKQNAGVIKSVFWGRQMSCSYTVDDQEVWFNQETFLQKHTKTLNCKRSFFHLSRIQLILYKKTTEKQHARTQKHLCE